MNIDVGDKVKVLHETETKGLVGAILNVVSTSPEYVEVLASGLNIKFKPDEVELYMPSISKRLKEIPKFYHGTDLKVAALGDQTRKIFQTASLEVAKFLYMKIEEFEKDNGDISQLFDEPFKSDKNFLAGLHGAQTNMLTHLSGSEDFQYGDFYLTTHWPDAVQYAQGAFAGGEIGTTAYYLTKAALLAGKREWIAHFDKAAEAIVDLGDSERFPIILEFTDIDLECLRTEEDENIERYIRNGRLTATSFRYNKPIDISKAVIHTISSDLKGELEKWKQAQSL